MWVIIPGDLSPTLNPANKAWLTISPTSFYGFHNIVGIPIPQWGETNPLKAGRMNRHPDKKNNPTMGTPFLVHQTYPQLRGTHLNIPPKLSEQFNLFEIYFKGPAKISSIENDRDQFIQFLSLLIHTQKFGWIDQALPVFNWAGFFTVSLKNIVINIHEIQIKKPNQAGQ